MFKYWGYTFCYDCQFTAIEFFDDINYKLTSSDDRDKFWYPEVLTPQCSDNNSDSDDNRSDCSFEGSSRSSNNSFGHTSFGDTTEADDNTVSLEIPTKQFVEKYVYNDSKNKYDMWCQVDRCFTEHCVLCLKFGVIQYELFQGKKPPKVRVTYDDDKTFDKFHDDIDINPFEYPVYNINQYVQIPVTCGLDKYRRLQTIITNDNNYYVSTCRRPL